MKSSFFSKIKTYLRKKYTVFLVLLGSTCMQNLRQFGFLTLVIKNSFLFDFCTDVLFNTSRVKIKDFIVPFLNVQSIMCPLTKVSKVT